MVLDKGHSAQDLELVMYGDNQTNIVLCNASLH